MALRRNAAGFILLALVSLLHSGIGTDEERTEQEDGPAEAEQFGRPAGSPGLALSPRLAAQSRHAGIFKRHSPVLSFRTGIVRDTRHVPRGCPRRRKSGRMVVPRPGKYRGACPGARYQPDQAIRNVHRRSCRRRLEDRGWRQLLDAAGRSGREYRSQFSGNGSCRPPYHLCRHG